VSKTFLADPLAMVASGWTLLTKMGFGHDIGMTVWRVVGGFVIAAVIALAARRGDGRLQADRGLLRALRQLRPLPAGERLHSRCSSSGPASARRRSSR
jgi:ABC-type nitrate/sulfonate/bicarbonate transport system permease component